MSGDDKFGLLLIRYIFTIWYFINIVDTFNVDTETPAVYSGPNASYFGYTVALLKNQEGTWVLVGAPKGEDHFQPLIRRPGALYKCRYPVDQDSPCTQVNVDSTGDSEQNMLFHKKRIIFHHDKSDQWLGVSLDVDPQNLSGVLICAHRWRDSYLQRKLNGITHMNGMCYQMNSSLTSPGRLIPALTVMERLVNRERYAEFSMGALGMSAEFTESNEFLAFGAPGLNDWSGGAVIERLGNSPSDLRYIEPQRKLYQDSYVGYSIATGYFMYRNSKSIALGAPRTGKVLMYSSLLSSRGSPKVVLSGDQIGCYFGASLLSVDVNNDFLDDLVVGAPMYADTHSSSGTPIEQGRVFIFLSRGIAGFKQSSAFLDGDKKNFARFGSSLASMGDINGDGYSDIVVGAPYEDDGSGSIYIYNGCTSGGVWPKYTQKISALQISTILSGFGISFSRSMDVDTNGYQDIAVGSYRSDQALLLRVRPVISVTPKFLITPAKYYAENTCDISGTSIPCIEVAVCFTSSEKSRVAEKEIGLNFTVRLGSSKSMDSSLASLFVYTMNKTQKVTKFTDSLVIQSHGQRCGKSHIIYIQQASVMEDIRLELEYDMYHNMCNAELCPMINKFNGRLADPVLQNRYATTVIPRGKCEGANWCIPNITIGSNLVNYRTNDSSFYPDVDPKFLIKLRITNDGYMAQNMKINQTLPSYLAIRRVHDASSSTEYHCTYTMDHKYNNFTCFVGNIDKDLIIYFEYYLKASCSTSGFIVPTVLFTSGFKIESHIMVPVKSASQLLLTGLSTPQDLLVKVYGETTESETKTISHTHILHNIGPNTLKHGILRIRIPTYQSYIFLADFQSDVMYSNSSIDCRHRVNSTRQHRRGIRNDNITCLNYPCDWILCDVKFLENGGLVKITVNITYKKIIFTENPDNDNILYVSESRLLKASNDTSNDRVQTYKVSTAIYPVQFSNVSGEFHYWIVVISLIIGFLLVVFIGYILFKCGFFRRRYRESLRRKKQAKNLQLARNYNQEESVSINDFENESETSVMIPPPSYSEISHICEASNTQTYTPMGVNNEVYLEPIQS